MNRRDFLRSSSTLVAAGAATGSLVRPARAVQPLAPSVPQLDPAAEAKNVIFMVADGMSIGALTLADLVHRQRYGKPCNWVSLWNRPGVRRGTMTTYSADAWVTDSAAGGSAWGCGAHINNGALNITPEGEQKVPILMHAQQTGRATGVVTTTRVTHATPASFVVNVPKRDMSKAIAQQMMERGLHVVMGGGAKHFPKELLEKHPGRQVITTREDLVNVPKAAFGMPGQTGNGTMMGLFADDHIPMVLDRTPAVPTLGEMTTSAIARLGGTRGYVLQVEGGRVDHAAHNNDAASLIAEMLEFDAAIGEVVKHLGEGNRDTLLVLTTDHANANPGLTIYGKPGRDAFARLGNIKHSFDWVWEELAKRPGDTKPTAVAEIVEAATGFQLDKTERALLAAAVSGRRTAAFSQASTWTSVLGGILADHVGVAFTGPNHTSDMVEVTAMGPGSELVQPMLDNVDLHRVMVSAMQLPAAKLLPGMEKRVEPASGVIDD